MIALAVMLAVTPTPAAARVFIGGGVGWGPGWYGPGWYGPGWYGPGWGAGYYPGWGPPHGTVKIDTHDKADAVFIDGGYAGTVADMHKFDLRPGAHDLAVRAPNGQELYNQRVEVLRGKTTKIHLGA